MKILRIFLLIAMVLALAGCLFVGCLAQELDAPTGLSYDGHALSWGEVEGATGYQVQLDGEIIAEPEEPSCLVSVSSGEFCVRALGKKDAKSPWSQPLNYTAPTPQLPALSTPTVLEVDGEGTLRWTPIVGAVSYRVWVNTELYTAVDTPYCTLTLEGDGYRTIQVSAVAGQGYRDSARSASFKIEIKDGKVVPPKVTAVVISFDPASHTLNWSAVRNAQQYAVFALVGGTNRLMTTVDAQSDKAAYSYLVNPPQEGVEYWVVAMGDGIKYADAVASNRIAFPLQAAAAPKNLRVTVIEGVPHLAWDNISSVTGYEIRMERDGETRLLSSETPYTRLSDDGTWAVSVRGVGDNRIFRSTLFSQQLFVTVTGGNISPLPLDIPGGMYLNDHVLYWDAISGASGYQVLIDTPATDLIGQYVLSSDRAHLEVDSHLWSTPLEVYVRALGGAGYASSAWSAGAIFVPDLYDEEGNLLPHTHSALATPVLTYDGDTFSWRAIGGATSYELTVNGITYPLDTTTKELPLQGGITAKVRAISETEGVLSSPWSVEYSYAYPIRLSCPLGLSFKGDTLSWESVAHASGYVVRVGNDTYETLSTSIHMQNYLPYDGEYEVAVKAVGEGIHTDSPYSEWIIFVVDYEEAGSEHKPYQLSAKEDLALLSQHPQASFALSADIAVGEIDSLFDYLHTFSGTLDGKGHSLTDIKVKGTDASNGLLGYMQSATIKDVTFVFDSVEWGELKDGGILATYAVGCTFKDVHVTATAAREYSYGVIGIAASCTFDGLSAILALTGQGNYLGLIGQASSCTLQDVQIGGSLTGGHGTTVGAVIGKATECTLIDVQVGTSEQPLEIKAGINTGALVGRGDGTIEGAVVYAHLEGTGTMGSVGYWIGDFAGQVQLTASVRGNVTLGGAVGHGSGHASGSYDVTVTGQEVNSLIVGTIWGLSESTAVEEGTSLSLTVNAAASSGHIGGVVGLGSSAYTGVTHGQITTSTGVTAGKISGLEESADENWSVTKE